MKCRGDLGQGCRLQRLEPAEREERHIGDAVAGQIVDQGVVAAMREIVVVLNADDRGDPASFRDLRGRDVAEPDVADEALPLELGQGCQRRFDRPFGGAVRREHGPQVDDLENIEAEVAQVVVDRLRQLLGREGRVPGFVVPTPGADLGDDHEVVGVGRQRFADQLVRNVRPVEVAGVDVVDAALNRFAQHH